MTNVQVSSFGLGFELSGRSLGSSLIFFDEVPVSELLFPSRLQSTTLVKTSQFLLKVKTTACTAHLEVFKVSTLIVF